MKLNNIIYGILGVGLAATMTSCGGFLDTVPDTRVELNSVEKARMLLVDAYPANNPAVTLEFSTDNIVDNNTADENGTRFNLPTYDRWNDEVFAFEDIKTSSDEDAPSGLWSGYYGAVASANAVLECLDKLQARVDAGEEVAGAKDIAAVRGEALMIRAFAHFMLANIFCEQYRGPELSKDLQGLPYPTEPETTVMPHYQRGNLADFYDKIEADIQEGLPLISNSIYTVPKYHFNRQAAYAFAARFYLTKRDYKKVLEYCNVAFGGEAADPSQYMSDIWAHLDDFYYISDFGLYYQGTEKPRNFLLLATYSRQWRYYIGGLRYACNRDGLRATIKGPGPTWENFRWIDSSTGERFSMHPAFNGCCANNSKSQYGTYFAGNCNEQFEYTNKVAGIGYLHVTRAELTGEETILMRAEAKLFLGDKQGAIDDLRIWELARRNSPSAVGSEDKFRDLTEGRIKAFYYSEEGPGYGIVKDIHLDEVTPSDQYSVTADILPVLQCIQHFRRIEFVHTGVRFFDLKRYGIEWSHKIGPQNRIETMTLFDPRRAIQIPPEVLSAEFEPTRRVSDQDNALSAPCAPFVE